MDERDYKMKHYLLFDLDGTLTDPKIGITTCVQYALHAAGIEEPDLDKLEPFIGPPLKDSFMEFYGMSEEAATEAVEKYRERFRDIGIFENKMYDGIPAMLRKLQSKGMHLAVASSKPTVYVKRILEHFHIDRYFEVVVGSELDGTRVNKDEVVQEALNQLFHYKPIMRDQVYMIGDRKFDVEGARAMGVESVGVSYGYGDIEELKSAKADYIVQSVEELEKFLMREVREETPAGKKASPYQRIWAIAYPLLFFLVMRTLFMYFLLILSQLLLRGRQSVIADWLFVLDENGELVGLTGNGSTIFSATASVIAVLIILPRAKKVIEKNRDDMRLSHLRREPKSSYVLLAFGTLGATFGLNLLLSLIGLAESSASFQEVARSQYSAAVLVGLICFGLVTPIVEEVIFRGIAYGYLRHFTKIRFAILISAILFSVYHGNSVQGIYAFLMGCLIAYGYEYFGSFLIPVCMHTTANLLAYALTYLPVPASGVAGGILCVISLAMMAGGFYGLHRRKNVL